MQTFEYKTKKPEKILALGAESNGNFSFLLNKEIHFSKDFGDLQNKANFIRYKKSLLSFIKENEAAPDIILFDLHPDYVTTILGKALAKKYKAKHIQVQHHIAHIYSAIGDKQLRTKNYKLPTNAIGIACDGTGFGLDDRVWGGEIFNLQTTNHKLKTIRIGHLENQILLGGELAIQEPARMLISILSKFLSKDEVYRQVKKYYSAAQFKVLYNQLQQNFNCIETSSTGRVLDAVSLLLGFCGNKRKYKHEPIEMLEINSTKPYNDLRPIVKKRYELKTTNYELLTTALFEYLIKNIDKDKKRLAATAQMYIAQGLWEIIRLQTTNYKLQTFLAGGIANNKIISTYLESKGVYTNKKIPRGDAGLSFGQIFYYLADPGN